MFFTGMDDKTRSRKGAIFGFVLLALFAITLFFAVAAKADVDGEGICKTLAFDGVLSEDIFERCMVAMDSDGIPHETYRDLEKESYQFYLANKGVNGTWTMRFLSEYLGVNGAVFYDGPVNQNDLDLCLDNGFCFNIWGSIGLDNSDFFKDGDFVDFDDEIDVALRWSREIGRGIGFTVTLPYYAVAEGDVVGLLTEFARTCKGVEYYLGAESYWPVEGSVPAKGQLYRLGVRRGFEPSDKLSVNGSLGTFFDTDAFGFEEGFLGEGTLSFVWSAGRYELSAPSVKCTAPLESMHDGRGFDCAVGMVVSTSF